MQKLLESMTAASLNHLDSIGQTPLAALLSRMSEVRQVSIRALVEAGADLNRLAEFPVLHHFRRGFDFGAKGSQPSTPLIVAAVRWSIEIVELLLGLGADINLADADGLTPLMHAVRTNSTVVVKKLLTNKTINVKAIDARGRSVVDHCVVICDDDDASPVATFDSVEMLELLLAAGAVPTMSTLKLASVSGATKIADRLAKILKAKGVKS